MTQVQTPQKLPRLAHDVRCWSADCGPNGTRHLLFRISEDRKTLFVSCKCGSLNIIQLDRLEIC